MDVRHPMGVLHSCSIKNIFHDKMDVKALLFSCVTIRINERINSQIKTTKNIR